MSGAGRGSGKVGEEPRHLPAARAPHARPAPRHAHFLPLRGLSQVPSPGEPDAQAVSSPRPLRLPGCLASPREPTRAQAGAPGGGSAGVDAGRSWAPTATERGGDTALRRWGPGALLHAGGRRGGGCGTCPPGAFPFSSSCCSSASSSGEDRRRRR